MQEFGVKLELGPEGAAKCLEEAGVTFMFAPRFHPAMRAVVPVRRALKVRTAFNVLGPMLNPAGATYGLVGVYNTQLARLMAESLQVCAAHRTTCLHIACLHIACLHIACLHIACLRGASKRGSLGGRRSADL